MELKKGTSFMAGGGDGQSILIDVVEFSDDEVKTLLKHPLATKNIMFEAEVLSVTDPAPPPMPSDALADE